MPRLFVGNFEFEHQLSGGEGMTLPVHIRRRNVEMSFLWCAVADDGDYVLLDAGVDDEFVEAITQRGLPRVNFISSREIPQGLELCPWGWSREMRLLAARHRCRATIPDEDSVARVNSRRFSFALERDWNVGLPRAAEFFAVEPLCEYLRETCGLASRWVIKSEFGMSGRERILGTGPSVSESDVGWMQRRLARGQRLYFEPWIEKFDEVGLQFFIPETSEPEFIACTELLNDARGQYRGSRWSDRLTDAWRTEIEHGMNVARAVQHEGYFGSLGIDAMRYLGADGEVRSRPIQDLNARWTMGRLAYGCRRFVPPACCFSVLHLAAPAEPVTISEANCRRLLPQELMWETGRREPLSRQVYLLWAATNPELAEKETALVERQHHA